MSQAELEHASRSYGDLYQLVSALTYKPGWKFRLLTGYTYANNGVVQPESLAHATTMGSRQAHAVQWDVHGTTFAAPPLFEVGALVYDSTESREQFRLNHLFVVPDSTFALLAAGKEFWRRFLMECIVKVETHEAMEWFALDGFKCFYPEHGPAASLYVIHDRTPKAA